MKKLIYFFYGLLSYLVIVILFTGWDNMTSHQYINTAIARKFILRASDPSFASGKFKNYSFKWDGDGAMLLEGDEYSTETSENKLEAPVNVLKKYIPLDWITKGSWMEDVPWGPSALRHFYDPIAIDGQKYLTDRSGWTESALSPIMSWASISAVDWATSKENPYSWSKAKEYMVNALKDPSQRNRNMALAYRCLGHVMHLVADMGCPPHVRNDSHPPNVWGVIGDPDPTEKLTINLDPAAYALARSANSGLAIDLGKSERMDVIMHLLAKFVNERFPSNQTIRTDREKQVIRPNNPYPSPLMVETDYNMAEHTYYKTYDSYKVKMCKDIHPAPMTDYILTGKDSIRGFPYIDYDCVQSQLASIMPNTGEACLNLIRVFIPALEVSITEAKPDSGGIVRGKIKYLIGSSNDEYISLIDQNNIYNGPVSIYVNGKKLTATANAVKNNFTFNLTGSGTTLQKDDKVVTEIEFGGISIKSDEAQVGASLSYISQIKNYKVFRIEYTYASKWSNGTLTWDENYGYEYFNNYCYQGNGNFDYIPINWSSNSFNFSYKSNTDYYMQNKWAAEVSVTLLNDCTIQSLKANHVFNDTVGYGIELKNIKANVDIEYDHEVEWTIDEGTLNDNNYLNYVSKIYSYSGAQNSLKKVDWKTFRLKVYLKRDIPQ